MITILLEKMYRRKKQKTINSMINFFKNNINLLDFDLMTMQTYIDKNNNEFVEDVSFEKLIRRAVNITANAKFNKRMKNFKFRREI